MSKRSPRELRIRRHRRVRAVVQGTPERPRLAVFRSGEHIYAQVIDDLNRRTIVAASTVEPEIREALTGKTKTQEAHVVGDAIGKRARAKGIEKVVFDRGGFLYHGRVAELANAARESGLQF
jgi:large subunit ribosomal protein L18